MNNADQKREKLLTQRKQILADFLGTSFEQVIERFTADLLGCLSGGSNERDQARKWLLFCFHQYFGSGDYDKDNEQLEKLRSLLHGFSEPTNRELENGL